ncbi:hypothetical protein BGZ60DRAFT_382317 [Tricladium varicosporioides]|nr:hypothetical protein BGZ60DRAFT_382317 [Hymenoscyphus varicosporioides]
MPPIRIPIDGLWRCLCPSVESIASLTSARCMRPRQNSTFRSRRVNGTFDILRSQAFHTSRRRREETPTTEVSNGHTTNDNASIIRYERGSPRKNDHPLDVASTHQIHDRLWQLKTAPDSFDAIVEAVRYLIMVRGEKPAITHYDALIRANCDAKKGSVVAVKRLLEDMREANIGPNSELYHAVLQVLAIHPDYLLRSQILEEMKQNWFGLSPDGWHFLIVGLIRDRQYEAAMDKFEQMQTDGIQVQPWLYDIFIFQLCEAGELDEAFKLLTFRFDNHRKQIHPSVWYYCLDKFSQAFHDKGTTFIWRYRVANGYLNPSDGICTNALNIAARFADPVLATSVVRLLSSRRTTLSLFHYEALLASYIGSDDMKTAFRIIGVIERAGFVPDSAMARPIFIRLTTSPELPPIAWEILKEQFESGHEVHTVVVNVVIEATIANGQFLEAMNFYKDLHNICKSGPNIDTFNVLLQGAEKAQNKDHAMFLASEMLALGVKADFLTYDRLIMICLREDDYEDAFNYLHEMIAVGKDKFENGMKGWWVRCGTATELARRCIKEGDTRASHIIEGMRQRGKYNPTYTYYADKLSAELEKKMTKGQSSKWSDDIGVANY